MVSRFSYILILAISLTCLVSGQKQKGRYLADVPLYPKAKFKLELEDEKSPGIRVYSRIYQSKDSIEKVVAWYEMKLPEAKKSNGVRRQFGGSPWTFFEFEPEEARELSGMVKDHSKEFVGVRVEKNALNSATDISLVEFVPAEE